MADKANKKNLINEENKISVIWLCNIVIPEFSDVFEIKKNPYGGWISGMLSEVERMKYFDVAFVFPIRNKTKMKDGCFNGHRFYSFLCNDIDQHKISDERIKRFLAVLNDFDPDIVHIWGTEYPWTLEMLLACEKKRKTDRAVISIQGLTSICARRYNANIEEKYLALKIPGFSTIMQQVDEFRKQGDNEKTALKLAKNVIGRTDWDYACVTAINPGVKYFHGREILRNGFYDSVGFWDYSKCEKHSIFVSQASYPIKGFHYLIRAVGFVKHKYQNVHVYVGGSNEVGKDPCSPYFQYLMDEMDKYDISDNVSFLGTLSESDMIEQYCRANIFVSPSAMENSSNSVCEALMIGVPVVASFVGGMSSVIRHMDNGLLYPETEVELLASYIIKLFEEKQLCKTISRNAVGSAKTYNSREKSYAELLNCYSNIIGVNSD